MSISVRLLNTWDEVYRLAGISHSCFMVNSSNLHRAKEHWDMAKQDLSSSLTQRSLLYYGYYDETSGEGLGYVRVLAGHEYPSLGLTWIVDYCIPFDYEAIQAVAEALPGVVLCKRFDICGRLSVSWPSLWCAIPQLGRYHYHQQGADSSTWLIVHKREERIVDGSK